MMFTLLHQILIHNLICHLMSVLWISLMDIIDNFTITVDINSFIPRTH